MDENTKLMDKKVDDLTVADALKVNVGIMIAVIVVPVALGAVAGGVKAGVSKIRQVRENRRNSKNTTDEEK